MEGGGMTCHGLASIYLDMGSKDQSRVTKLGQQAPLSHQPLHFSDPFTTDSKHEAHSSYLFPLGSLLVLGL